jgi:glycosyltransferase involved in cell wall biosynthesis
LALKATLQEPVLCLADPLYQYRMVAAKIFAQGLEENHAMHAIRQSFIKYFATHQLGYNPPPPKPPFSANPPRGICFVRTQGKRFDYLLDALLSIQKQTQPLTPCVIVHANDETFLKVQDFLQEQQIQAILLHAPDLKRRRGYPLNVGIDYLRAHQKDYDYLCFLDDDDIFYPNFAQILSQALQDSGKDSVFAQTMGKTKDGNLIPIHPPLPPICLLASNFIPINAYVVTTDFFLQANIRFPENMDYVEDWDILLQMLAQGAMFMPVFETLAEIRLIGDCNAPFKNDPKHFEDCYQIISNRASAVVPALSRGRFLLELAKFSWGSRYPLNNQEIIYLKNAQNILLK